MQDIPHNRDLEPVKTLLVLSNRQHVQHRLGRVRMAAVAGIDNRHARRHGFSNKMRGAAAGMTHHKHVAGHRLKIQQGIGQ